MYAKLLEEKNALLSSALSNITAKSANFAEYGKTDEKKLENYKYFEVFANREQWPHYGILNAKELARLTLIEHILSPTSEKPANYFDWKPTN